MNAELINPFDGDSWGGARAYTTNLDTNLYKSAIEKGKLPQFRRNIERELKVLLLTKNRVVTGASSMITPFGYDFLRDHPILLEEKLLIPAVGNHVVGDDYKNGMKTASLTEYYLNRVKSDNKDLISNMSAFFNENIHLGVGWDLQNNTSGFKEKIIDGLNNKDSVISANLVDISSHHLFNLIEQFNKVEGEFSRKDIEKTVQEVGLSKEHSAVIFKFQELSYNNSGATVVNCEASLQNKDLALDYGISDLLSKKSILTEKQVFYKLFFELFFENILNTTAIPINALDYLSFEEIVQIRNDYHDTGFVESYNAILKEVNSAVYSDVNHNTNAEILKKVGLEIENRFTAIFDYVRKVAIEKGMIKGLSIQQNNIGYGLANFHESGGISSLNVQSISYINDFNSLLQSRTHLEKHDYEALSKFKFLKSAEFSSALDTTEIQSLIAFASEMQQILHNKITMNSNFT